MGNVFGFGHLNKACDWLWEIPQSYRSDMRVPARVYASEKMLQEILRDKSLEQLVNVATLPGIQKYALAMPDVHEGYGFPVGGVAAFDAEAGIISPGGIGYDINCGVRLLKSELDFRQAEPHLDALAKALFKEIPSGVGRGGRLKLNNTDLDGVLKGGVGWMLRKGYGEEYDASRIESGGVLAEANPEAVSAEAKNRGRDQLGTMGAGNHFVEVDRVEEILEAEAAKKLGLYKDQIVVLIHCGSRGLGHQVATDYIRVMLSAMPKYKITLPDRELASAPFSSPEGKKYFSAMSAAANFAWANRQLITWEARQAWRDVFGDGGGKLDIVYDVAHNIAKIEEYFGKKMIVHRKGATRAFDGQPVLIPGSMGTASYVLVGTKESEKEAFGSSCHGAGRRMSRHTAKSKVRGSELKTEMEKEGICIAAGSFSGLAEEAPFAYKDVNEVVDIVHRAGIAKKVARLRPAAVVKG